MSNKIIDRFDGQYRFLSNFYETPLLFRGLVFESAEAAFHSQKCPQRAKEFRGLNASQSKRLGRQVEIRPDWDKVRDQVMYEVVFEKFSQNSEIRELLIATGEAMLVEGNTWNDRYWGVCNGIGQNKLGKILMRVRSELLQKEQLFPLEEGYQHGECVASNAINAAGIQTCYPFFADDEVPCVNTNECHAKAADKCPFCARDFEDCAGKECTVQQSEQERFRNTDIFQPLLQKYQKVFGEIIFPDEPKNGQSEVRREIYANPAGWMYSHDGLRWRTAPMDIGKIAYENAMFRRIPEGIIVGVNEDVKKAPQDFQFSTNNGLSWTPLQEEGRSSSSVWVFHGRHDGVWFRRKG